METNQNLNLNTNQKSTENSKVKTLLDGGLILVTVVTGVILLFLYLRYLFVGGICIYEGGYSECFFTSILISLFFIFNLIIFILSLINIFKSFLSAKVIKTLCVVYLFIYLILGLNLYLTSQIRGTELDCKIVDSLGLSEAKERCYAGLAGRTENADFCKKTGAREEKCNNSIANKTNNISLCEDDSCRSKINYLKTPEVVKINFETINNGSISSNSKNVEIAKLIINSGDYNGFLNDIELNPLSDSGEIEKMIVSDIKVYNESGNVVNYLENTATFNPVRTIVFPDYYNETLGFDIKPNTDYVLTLVADVGSVTGSINFDPKYNISIYNSEDPYYSDNFNKYDLGYPGQTGRIAGGYIKIKSNSFSLEIQ